METLIKLAQTEVSNMCINALVNLNSYQPNSKVCASIFNDTNLQSKYNFCPTQTSIFKELAKNMLQGKVDEFFGVGENCC